VLITKFYLADQISVWNIWRGERSYSIWCENLR